MKRKAKELALQLFNETNHRFPEILFLRIQPHPEQADRYWIKVRGTMDEQQERLMDTFVADRATDILIDEGYSFAVMLENVIEVA
jgi:hypothetical protein